MKYEYKTKSRHYFNHVGTGRQFDKMANRGWLKKKTLPNRPLLDCLSLVVANPHTNL
jgi:hypothetical protein